MSQPRSAPTVVVTVAVPEDGARPDISRRKNDLYVDAVARAGAEPIVLDARSSTADREQAFTRAAGLVLTGGPDIDPARYGRPLDGSVDIDPDRDELEASAWRAAEVRGLPVLGICRGLQAINVFSGGTLLQHVAGHEDGAYEQGPAKVHPLRLVPGTRVARILVPRNVRGAVITVNSYHHQAVRAADLAPGLAAAGWSSSPAGDLVEALEGTGERFVVGIQCHPERRETTPPEFDRLWRFFVDACRGPASARVEGSA
jgi:putative glutamine amidotransferase